MDEKLIEATLYLIENHFSSFLSMRMKFKRISSGKNAKKLYRIIGCFRVKLTKLQNK